jgi:hypothetical protein
MSPAPGKLCTWHRCLAMLLAVALGFLALAVFSPLHKHDAAGRCSLNNFEHITQEETQASSPSLELCHIAWTERGPAAETLRPASLPSALFRGPPASL